MKHQLILLFIFLSISFVCYGQNSLNKIFSTYASNIKVCNVGRCDAKYVDNHHCIYKANNFSCNLNYNFLIIEYNFENIKHDKFIINLKTATIYNGYWQNRYGKWEQSGSKNILTIQDDNGIDMFSTGLQSYNKGTRQNLITLIHIDMGTVPIANRAMSEIQTVQEKFKSKEPWLQPVQETQPQPSPSSKHKTQTHKRSFVNERKNVKSKSGKYGE